MAFVSKLNVLMCGSGEYTTGWTGSGASKSDKKVGVVGLTLFDLRRFGKVDKLGMVGVNGSKFPAIREHLEDKIGKVYKDLDLTYVFYPRDPPLPPLLGSWLSSRSRFTQYPEVGKVDPEAYKTAIDALKPGDAVIIFTPDSTHYPIALYALERKMHVLITKPATQKLAHHQHLIQVAEQNHVVCWVEHHKRFDPAYADAKHKARALGDFNFFSAWMSQPKSQLETFKAWAGKDSDISYYLSSHHIDIHAWIMGDRGYPTKVTASASAGIATSPPYSCVPQTEDTITLLAVYTASWTAPTTQGIHSAQHWHYMGSKGDVQIDQAHRGYDVTVDGEGKTSYNPFYMKYTPSETGHFDGQRGYGYISIEKFTVESPVVFDQHDLPTIRNTVLTTAILEAGRRSLDEKRSVGIEQNANGEWIACLTDIDWIVL
ncbi:hypothetical protein BS47DRAFT_1372984 [Hydnum rufescens UP504]|uniref:Gfo/Idh/MocA-like oxidoreductase N-terminal domain-containing protein n=1 Tax=Hydnum rufescens UP504 TaxID=1448309 RepID=A0A9P6AVP3_9AGAM|nr:hypothetical protein BS47DRAFT_1372984 [Hydnum rufescens UP504]